MDTSGKYNYLHPMTGKSPQGIQEREKQGGGRVPGILVQTPTWCRLCIHVLERIKTHNIFASHHVTVKQGARSKMRPLLQHRANVGLEGTVKPMIQLTWDFVRFTESIHLLRHSSSLRYLLYLSIQSYLHKGSKLSSKTSKNPSPPFSLKSTEDVKINPTC